jgi:hypothetical protein
MVRGFGREKEGWVGLEGGGSGEIRAFLVFFSRTPLCEKAFGREGRSTSLF